VEAGSGAANEIFVTHRLFPALPALSQHHLRLFLRRRRILKCIHISSFVISEKGLIEKVFEKVDTKNHTNQILEEMKM
jgi:hypothetical protein